MMSGRGERQTLVSFLFYQAVRDLKPVWMLEDMRTTETFFWEEDPQRRTYSPAEALLYATVHDHRAYARYLLGVYAGEALLSPGGGFLCCPSSAPHLAMAVRYDRRHILALILRVCHRAPGLASYLTRRDCFHLEDGKTPLHLACELLRADAVVLLLGNGASPHARDRHGLTPLDVLLQQLWDSKVNAGAKRRCLELLLMFSPRLRFQMRGRLREDPGAWARLLGEETLRYLTGLVPAPLALRAMQTVLALLPPARFPASLEELPIPAALKPLPREIHL